MSLDVFSSASRFARAIRAGEVSASEVLEMVIAQIEQHNATLNAIVTLDVDGARKRAQEADEALARGEIRARCTVCHLRLKMPTRPPICGVRSAFP